MRRSLTVTIVAAGLLAATASTASGVEGPPPRSIAVIGDFGSGDAAEARVAALVERASPVSVVTTGDNVYDSADYTRLVGDYYGAWVDRRRFLPALGNHDYAEGIEAYADYFDYLRDLRHYTRVLGDVQFFFLDSESALTSPSARASQRAWLARWLPRSTTPWQVVVLHHPPHSSGSVHGSTPDLQWPYRAWGADLVLSGHEHQYERIVRDGLTYVVNGAGGKDLYPFGKALTGSRVRYADGHGALFLSATPVTLTGEFWTTDGRRIDRFALRRPAS